MERLGISGENCHTSAQNWIWQCLTVCTFSVLVPITIKIRKCWWRSTWLFLTGSEAEFLSLCLSFTGRQKRETKEPISPSCSPLQGGLCGLHQPLQFDACCCALACSLESTNTSCSTVCWRHCCLTPGHHMGLFFHPLSNPSDTTVTHHFHTSTSALRCIWTGAGAALVWPYLTTSVQSVWLHMWWLL